MKSLQSFYGPEVAARADTPLPADYIQYRACKEYILRESPGGLGGRDGTWAVQWRHGPFRFERFMSDAEPAHERTGLLRLRIWQRLSRQDVPAGWWRAPEDMGIRMTGFATLEGDDERTWSAHARRHLARWRKLAAAGERELVELTLDEYLAAYALADQDALMKLAYPKVVREWARAQGERMRFFGSRRHKGPIDSGLAFMHVPEAGQSVHVAAFIGGDAKGDSAATGLVAKWFDECRVARLRYLDFGFFWAPGDPRDWRGFSRFKSQFGVRLLRYPRPLIRLAGSLFGRQ